MLLNRDMSHSRDIRGEVEGCPSCIGAGHMLPVRVGPVSNDPGLHMIWQCIECKYEISASLRKLEVSTGKIWEL